MSTVGTCVPACPPFSKDALRTGCCHDCGHGCPGWTLSTAFGECTPGSRWAAPGHARRAAGGCARAPGHRAWEHGTVFERFTERARHALVLAQDESRELGHAYIGTEHLLL